MDVASSLLDDSTSENLYSTAGQPTTDPIYRYNDPGVFHVFWILEGDDSGESYPTVLHRFLQDTNKHEMQSLTHLKSYNKRQHDNNDRWVFSYAANSQLFEPDDEHYPDMPRDTVMQMANDLMGKLNGLDADDICIDFNGEFGLWGKLQVSNEDTEGGIEPSQCDPYYNNDFEGGDRWNYTYQVHDEL